jgi:hypothetical protein
MRIPILLVTAGAFIALAGSFGAGDAVADATTVAHAVHVTKPVKPARERIPASAKVVTITPTAEIKALPAGDRPVTITNRSRVTRIAAAVDGLPLFPPGVYHCPIDDTAAMRLTFRASRSGPALAVVTDQVGGCGGVAVIINGHSMPTLWHGRQLEQQVMHITGIRWLGLAS